MIFASRTIFEKGAVAAPTRKKSLAQTLQGLIFLRREVL